MPVLGPGVMANNQRVQISHCRTLSQADRPDRARGAGRISGQGGQNSARNAEKKFSFAHPGFQFAHPAIRNGCSP